LQLLETFPFFDVAVLAAQDAGVHNELTHWRSIACTGWRIAYTGGRIADTALYIFGIPLIRWLFWNAAAFGMLAVLAAPFVPPEASDHRRTPISTRGRERESADLYAKRLHALS
jgi:uncharacterized MAPEG superfamily protein